MRPDVSIVIASFNTTALTRRCLRAIFEQTSDVSFEVIVIDNASSDGSADDISREFATVRLTRLSKNIGFAPAQNVGIRQSAGEMILVLNSDALMIGNAIKTMIDGLRRQPPDVAMLGPQILNPDHSVAPSARRTLPAKGMMVASIVNRHFNVRRWLPEVGMRRYLGWLLSRWHDNYQEHDRPRFVEYVDGMCALVRRDVLEKVGLFDEQFFFDYEILDLANRIRAAGGRIIFDPAAQVLHLGHASRKNVSRIVIESYRSLLTYYAKYAPEQLPLAQRVITWTIRARRLATTGANRHAALGIYGEILELVRTFDAAAARSGERIPFLPDAGLRL
jgi:GT2 family glycosyltransferase